jgi:hypothetical protein
MAARSTKRAGRPGSSRRKRLSGRGLTAGVVAASLAGCVGAIDATSDGRGPGGVAPADPGAGPPPRPAPPPGAPGSPAPAERADPTGFSTAPAACAGGGLAPGTARLLTPVEYANTLRALGARFGLSGVSFVDVEEAEAPSGFRNDGERLELSAEYTEAVTKNAERLARELVAARARVHAGCAGAAPEADCARGLLAAVGAAAFRRSVTAAEQTRLVQRFATLRRTWGLAESLQGLLEIVLASPEVIHRSEIGEPVPGRGGVRRLAPHEVASALSYAITLGPPDAELARAADEGLLRETREIDAQVARLVEHKRVDGLARLLVELLDVDLVTKASKDPKLFPFFGPSVPRLLLDSFGRSAAGLMSGRDVTLADVFTSQQAWVRRELAPLFDLAGADGAFTQLTLAPARAGVYTHPAFLAAIADDVSAKPLHRARFVLEGALCVALPPPPPEADMVKPPDDPRLSERQKIAIMTSGTACVHCHRVINPLSHAFEAFDAVGRHRTKAGAHVIDPSGTVPIAERELTFRDARDLFEQLARDTAVRECFVTHVYTYLLGRALQKLDECSRQESYRAFERSGWNVQTLLRTVFTSESFRLRRGA